MPSPDEPLDLVRQWLEEQVLALDLCPFAHGPMRQGLVHLVESGAEDPGEILADLLHEAARLEEAGEGTTLLVLPRGPADFGEFLDLFYAAEDVLSAAGFDRKVQVVGFHPDFVFESAPADDPANAVNRSPVPLLHLLRWAEVHAAIEGHRDIRQVALRNARLLRERAGWDPVEE